MVSLLSSVEEMNLKDETMQSLMKRWEKKLKKYREQNSQGWGGGGGVQAPGEAGAVLSI